MKYCPVTDATPFIGRPSSIQRAPQGCSSIGRALVSKTSGCRFESYRPCHTLGPNGAEDQRSNER